MLELTEVPDYWFTPFQLACLFGIERIIQCNKNIELKLAPRLAISGSLHRGGEAAYYFLGCIAEAQIEFWIYPDEAMFFKDGKSFHFEKEDYKTERDIIAAFVEAISNSITK